MACGIILLIGMSIEDMTQVTQPTYEYPFITDSAIVGVVFDRYTETEEDGYDDKTLAEVNQLWRTYQPLAQTFDHMYSWYVETENFYFGKYHVVDTETAKPDFLTFFISSNPAQSLFIGGPEGAFIIPATYPDLDTAMEASQLAKMMQGTTYANFSACNETPPPNDPGWTPKPTESVECTGYTPQLDVQQDCKFTGDNLQEIADNLNATCPLNVVVYDMPYDEESYNKLIMSFFYSLVLGVLMGYITSENVSGIVQLISHERENGMKDLMSFLGLDLKQFWASQLVTYLYQQALPVLVNSIALIICITTVGNNSNITYSGGSIFYLLFAYWMFVLNAFLFGTALSSILQNEPLLEIFKYLSGWILNLLVPLMLILSLNDEKAGARVITNIIPQMNFCWSVRDAFYNENKVDTVLFNILNTVIWGSLTFYLDLTVKTSKGTAAKQCCFCCRKNGDEEDADEEDLAMDKKENFTSAAGNVVLELKQVTKMYGDFTAVDHLDLKLEDNQIFGLLGFNGAGKSTTINMITGQTSITSGSVFITGKDLKYNLESLRRVMGVCPQHNILWEGLSLWEHLKLFGRLRGIDDATIESESTKLMTTLDLLHVKDTLAGALSGGQKRKLMIIAAFMGNPKFVLLDEPTAGVDNESRERIQEFIHSQRHGKLILLTTHHMEQADALCDFISIMGAGKIMVEGPPTALKTKYGEKTHFSIPSEKIDHTAFDNVDARFHEKDDHWILEPSEGVDIVTVARQLTDLAGKDVKIENSSLEQVFLALSKKRERRRSTIHRTKLNLLASNEEEDGLSHTRPPLYMRAAFLFHKRLLSLYKNPWAFMIAILTMATMSVVTQFLYICFGVANSQDTYESLNDLGTIEYIGTPPSWLQYPSDLMKDSGISSILDFPAKDRPSDSPDKLFFYFFGEQAMILVDRFYYTTSFPSLNAMVWGSDLELIPMDFLDLNKMIIIILAGTVLAFALAFLLTHLYKWHAEEMRSGMYEMQCLMGVPGWLIWSVNFVFDWILCFIGLMVYSAIVFTDSMDFKNSLAAGAMALIGGIPFTQSIAHVVGHGNLSSTQLALTIVWILVFFGFFWLIGFWSQICDGGYDQQYDDKDEYQISMGTIHLLRFMFFMFPSTQYYLTAVCYVQYEYNVPNNFNQGWFWKHWGICLVCNFSWILIYWVLTQKWKKDPLTNTEEEPPATDAEKGMIASGMRKVFLDKAQNPLVAVQGVSFDIDKGTCYGLLGTNGAGKSTMMKMMSTWLPQTNGTGAIHGMDVKTQSAEIREILGICNQHDVFCPGYTGMEHLRFCGAMKGVPLEKLDDVIMDLAERLKFVEHLGTKCMNMSGGNKRKINFATSILGRSDIVFLDEPSAAIDPFARDCIKKVLVGFKEGRTILFTSHNLEETELLCDEIGLMKHGKMHAQGKVDDLIRDHANFYPLEIDLTGLSTESVENLKHRAKELIPSIEAGKGSDKKLSYKVPTSVELADAIKHTNALKEEFKCDLLLKSPNMNELFMQVAEGDDEPTGTSTNTPQDQ